MTKPFRVYSAIPVARDLRDPKAAKDFAAKANWVWTAFANRKRVDELVTRPIG